MACFGKSLAGTGYVILNIIRVLNILSLLAVIAASSVMLVKTFVVSKFFFFDACGHVIEVVISGFLIITELPIFRTYFAAHWPLFSQKSGFVMLGTIMILIGNGILGNLNKAATSQESLGLAAWRIVISSGIVVIIMGVVNLFASYIFRNTKIGLAARQVRSHGAVAEHKVDIESKSSRFRRSFHLGRRDSDSLPSYHSRSLNSNSEKSRSDRPRLNISSPINNDPEQFAKYATSPEVAIPDLAHHPAMHSTRI